MVYFKTMVYYNIMVVEANFARQNTNPVGAKSEGAAEGPPSLKLRADKQLPF